MADLGCSEEMPRSGGEGEVSRRAYRATAVTLSLHLSGDPCACFLTASSLLAWFLVYSLLVFIQCLLSSHCVPSTVPEIENSMASKNR